MMNSPPVTDNFRSLLGGRIRAEHVTIATAWLTRLSALLPVERADVFPSDHLLDHIPDLIIDVANYVSDPACEEIAANAGVLLKAQELGRLRYTQKASVHQIVREYRLFETVLVSFVRQELGQMSIDPAATDVIDLISGIHQAISVMTQATLDAFIERYSNEIATQGSQLETFNRMASHELRQPLGTLQVVVRLLQAESGTSENRERLIDMIARNVDRTVELTHRLTRLSGLFAAGSQIEIQTINLGDLARDATRQLREMASARQVVLRVCEPMPTVSVDVGAIELVLINLLSNGIKYSDPSKAERFVEISGAEIDDHHALVVRDNGLGIPASQVNAMFRQPLRIHAGRDAELGVDGLGLGLTIVHHCLRTLGATIALESVEGEGTVFTVQFKQVEPPSAPATL